MPSTLGRRVDDVKDRFALSSARLGITGTRPPVGLSGDRSASVAVFVAVARERNFTRAAERLHVAQPALSRQVKLLERELGVELLHRTTHEFELTEAGEFLLDRGPALLSAADELWRSARAYGTGESGEVRVAYGASASYETAPRLLQAVAERQPGVAITTEVKSVNEIVTGVARMARST